jgi:hypothetical protein
MSERWRAWLRTLARWLPPAGLLALVARLCLTPVTETDLFFRLRVGAEILTHHAIPRRNLFSFTYPDHPDLDPAWLFDVAVAVLHRMGGFPAIVVAKTVVVVGVFLAAYALCRRRAGPVASALALAAAALVMRERLVERPHVFSLAGEVAVLWALEVAIAPLSLTLSPPPAGRSQTIGGRLAYWSVVPITALWANLHAGAFLAPVLVGAAAIAERRRRLALLAAACAGALLLTPVGPGFFRYLFFHVGIFAVHPVDEFRPPTWTSDATLILYAAAIAAAVIVRRGSPLRAVLPAVALAVLAARSVRFGADFALVAAPILAAALTLPAIAWTEVACGVALAAAAILPIRRLDLDLDRSALPLDALAFVERQGLRERMYNDFELGAYLLWEGHPRHRVFVDPRLPAYPLEFHRLLGRPVVPRAEWDAALERHGVTSALLTYAGINHRIGFWDPARWALVYRQHDARVFVRRLPQFRALIAALEIPATFSFTPEAGAETIVLDSPPPGSPVPPCEWQRRIGDLVFELDDGNPTRALAAYHRALETPDCLADGGAAAWVKTLEALARKRR